MTQEYEFFKNFAGVTKADLEYFKCGGKKKKMQKGDEITNPFNKKNKASSLPNTPSPTNKSPLGKSPSGSILDAIKRKQSAPNFNPTNKMKPQEDKHPIEQYMPKKDPTNDKINGYDKTKAPTNDKINGYKRPRNKNFRYL